MRKRTVPHGFNKEVISRLDGNVLSSHVTMVRKGMRTNDRILMEIIKTDHHWNQIERERIKKTKLWEAGRNTLT